MLGLLVVAPLVLPEFWRRFATEILVWGLLAMSSDILIGYTGMVSFGHSAFFGLGLYGAAAAHHELKPPNVWVALIYGLVGAAAVAAFVAYFATRLRDIYFAITTLDLLADLLRHHLHLDGGDRRRERAHVRAPAALDPRALLGALHRRDAALVHPRRGDAPPT